MAQNSSQIDSLVQVITPENIAFEYRVAGPFRRLPAYLMDLLIRLAIFIGMGFGLLTLYDFFSLSNDFGAFFLFVMLFLWFVLDWFYGGVFETLWNGQTPGKRMAGLRVLSIDGLPITGLQAVLRNVLRSVDGLPLVIYFTGILPLPSFLLGVVVCAFSVRNQRLGDLACGTMVVVEAGEWFMGLSKMEEPEAIRLAGYLPANIAFTADFGRALSSYVQRRKYFSTARRNEIARHLAEPFCRRYLLSPETNSDLLLCALYYRAFLHQKHRAEAAKKHRADGGPKADAVAHGVNVDSASVVARV